MATLVITSGQQRGDHYPLGQRTSVVGRSEALPIQILDKQVSRKHMQIHYDRRRNIYYVLDMRSKHGVFINGRKIGEETVLSNDDRIEIGTTRLVFKRRDLNNDSKAIHHFNKVGERRHTTIIDLNHN
jgi:pSer/pThr/pTyr-binding forkhead associated (FHA) protein